LSDFSKQEMFFECEYGYDYDNDSDNEKAKRRSSIVDSPSDFFLKLNLKLNTFYRIIKKIQQLIFKKTRLTEPTRN